MGVPLWWVLGLFQAMFFVAALLMTLHLARRRDIELPRHFLVWVLFLTWTLGGVLTLQVDAPGAVPGTSMSRYFTFGFRYAWYLISTVALLYVVNTRGWLSTERICRTVSWFFIILVGGGVVGLLLPHLDFPSLLELVLPRPITQAPSVRDLIHPRTAQLQSILGDDPQPRPSAPFPYTNSWGMAVAITLPFFVHSWWNDRRRDRVVLLLVLAVATVPVVASLNRGLWLSVLALVAFTALRSAMMGDARRLAALLGVAAAVGLVLVVTPLGSTIQTRFETPHSDNVRENLGAQAVASTLEGSPLIGFGSTRDVAGNFNSIAGGASAICPGCEPPPLGTHGQAWLLIFSAGTGGLVLYVTFLGVYLGRHLLSRAPGASAATGTIFIALLTMPIYITTGIPLFIVFIAVGLLARSLVLDGSGPTRTLRELSASLRAGAWLVVVGLTLGTMTGLGVHRWLGEPVRASQSVLVPAIELTGHTDAPTFTLDSEAELARSTTVLNAVAQAVGGTSLSQVEQNLSIGARPNTRVLTVTYRDVDEDRAVRAVQTLVAEYLAVRADLHEASAAGLERRLNERYDVLRAAESELETLSDDPGSTMRTESLTRLRSEIAQVAADLDSLTAQVDLGRPLTQVHVRHPRDALLVRAGSGGVAGLALGVILAAVRGDRARGTRGRLERTTGLPVLMTLALGDESDPTGLLLNRVRPYLPLEAVIADPDSEQATRLAADVDLRITTPGGRSARTLLIVSSRTSMAGARSMIEECRSLDLAPVGLVIVSSPAR